ncbi:MAG: glycosyltransferase [Candidatus Aegiribacteria sp.]|nr:glycosyltransferase [Candidatus Aegiribacteria sp.]MBD3294005.1 glycosyltransferase [Candidatus Fermentibacteria bacterium]
MSGKNDHRPSLALFHNLPSGGGIRVVQGMVEHLSGPFRLSVYSPEGSAALELPKAVVHHEISFPSGRRISGIRKAAAPLVLPARLRAFEKLCEGAGAEMSGSSDLALIHNSMYVAAPPVLKYLEIPSVYYCYEFPRHLYEPTIVRRTRNRLQYILLSRLRWLEKKIDTESCLAADSVVCLSSWMKSRISDIYRIEADIVRPGIQKGFCEGYDKAEEVNRVLSVGALWPFKGHEMAMEAVAALPEDERPSLTVVADREFPGYGNRLMEAAEELNIELAILRHISDARLKELYSGSRAVLCCQRNEPYGMVPLEAMCCGTPVIAVSEGGFTDNIKDGENGLLVSRNSEEMAAALKRVLTEPALAQRISDGGMEFVKKRRSVASAAEQLIEILRESLE